MKVKVNRFRLDIRRKAFRRVIRQGAQGTCSCSVIGTAQGLNGHDFGHPDIVQEVLPMVG